MSFRSALLLFAMSGAALLLVTIAHAQSPEENELWLATRKGETAKVRALLEKGVNVNAKFRYGATALSFACDRGHVEIVKLLLERGAEVNVKDTFYGATPLQWALSPATQPASMKGHNQIVKMLLEKGADGKDQTLLAAVRRPDAELVRMVLEVGGLKPETLTTALDIAQRNNRTEIASQLASAGAVKRVEIKVDPETLQSYAGIYRQESGQELRIVLSEGKLTAEVPGQSFALIAQDKSTFFVDGLDGVKLMFSLEGGKVVSMTFSRGSNNTVYRRAGVKP